MTQKTNYILIIVFFIMQIKFAYTEAILDGTMKAGTAGITLKGNFEIKSDYGQIIGSNLFHSFSKFNINTNETASFTGPENIKNIFNRITGTEKSNINGILNSQISNANFYLLNPNGIIFGNNTKINIKGSFHVSSADYLIMENTDKLYIDISSPFISTAELSEFGFFDDSFGKIQINNCNIVVKPGNTISIIGGEIDILDSKIEASEGQINIVGVKSHCTISYDESGIKGIDDIKRSNITISDNTLIDVNGKGSGNIFILGGDFFFNNESAIKAETEGNYNGGITSIDVNNFKASQSSLILSNIIAGNNNKGGDVIIKASESVILSDDCKIKTSTSGSDAGDIHIFSKNLSLEGTSKISTRTTGFGKGGNISIFTSDNVRVENSYILSDTESDGNAGNIKIEARNILFQNGLGPATQTTKGKGNGGSIKLIADEAVSLMGTNNKGNACTITSFSEAKGNAGDIFISAKKILFKDGGCIDASSRESGNGGNITLKAIDGIIEIIGVNPHGQNYEGFNSGIFSQSEQTGKAGDIKISSNSLLIKNGALITNSTSGGGASGTIDINSKFVQISGSPPSVDSNRFLESQVFYRDYQDYFPQSKIYNISGIYSLAKSFEYYEESGGTISLYSSNLNLSDKATINSSSIGKRNAGDIILNINNLGLDTESSITSESLTKENGGAAGRINITANNSIKIQNKSSLTTEAINTSIAEKTNNNGKISIKGNNSLYLNNSNITTSVKGGTGKGGDIDINNKLVILNNSEILANAYEGKGGNISISTRHLIKSIGSKLEASSKLGIDGSINIFSSETDLEKNLAKLPDTFLDATKWTKTPCKSRTNKKSSHLIVDSLYAIPTSFEDLLANPFISFKQITVDKYIQQLLINTEECFSRADFSKALIYLEEALLLIDKTTPLYFHIISNLIYLYQACGHHNKSFDVLNESKHFLEIIDDDYSKALYYNRVADFYLSVGKINEAKKNLEQAETYTKLTKQPIIIAMLFNNKGNIEAINEDFREIKDYQNAINYYLKSLKEIEDNNIYSFIKFSVLINYARSEFLNGYIKRPFTILKNAFDEIKTYSNSYNKIFDLLAIGSLALKIFELSADNKIMTLCYDSLTEAKTSAISLDNKILISYSYSKMVELYTIENKFSDAIYFNKRALFFAEQENSELWFKLKSQYAKLQKHNDNINDQTTTYQCIIDKFNKNRQVFFKGYRSKQLSFYNKIRPVYLELADILLSNVEPKNSEEMFQKAINTIENLKKIEIEDFFKDECIKNNKANILYRTIPGTALIYPILFYDRLELLLILPDTIKQKSVSVSFDEVTEKIKDLFKNLANVTSNWNQYLYEYIKLYEWIIEPIESDLESYNIETLILAPDGPLRSIPFSALHDGNNFLIEKYAIVTIPAITLTSDKTDLTNSPNILINGLSEARFNFEPLKYVKNEIDEIINIVKSNSNNVLMNKEFTLNNIETRLLQKHYSIVHIASHAQFSNTLEETFILSYDEKITMKDLETLINISKKAEGKIDLLVLSACQTAQGDDRAYLGLAGIAARAGVKNVVASLWKVEDEATSIMMKEFYGQISSSDISISKALQCAQMYFIQDDMLESKYKRPFFWAPFLVIGY